LRQLEESKEVFQKVLDLSQIVVVPVVANPPAPAQGALAIEIRKDRADLKELLLKIKCTQSFADVIAERERLKDFGGGCHLKLGIYQKTTDKGVLKVECGLTPSGERLNSFAWESHKKAPQLNTSEIFDASQLNVFDRKVLKVEKPQNPLGLFLYVSKTEALPSDWSLQEKDIVWTAGLETW
jgi:hydroxymethylbilane synthase